LRHFRQDDNGTDTSRASERREAGQTATALPLFQTVQNQTRWRPPTPATLSVLCGFRDSKAFGDHPTNQRGTAGQTDKTKKPFDTSAGGFPFSSIHETTPCGAGKGKGDEVNKIWIVRIHARGVGHIVKNVIARTSKAALLAVIESIGEEHGEFQAAGWELEVFEASQPVIL
jgi:hypothetical protein